MATGVIHVSLEQHMIKYIVQQQQQLLLLLIVLDNKN